MKIVFKLIKILIYWNKREPIKIFRNHENMSPKILEIRFGPNRMRKYPIFFENFQKHYNKCLNVF
jgi:hypothetical protein